MKVKQKIIYLYNGGSINYELTFIKQANELDKNRLKMNIIVYNENEDKNNKNEATSKNIICPKCKEFAIMNIKNFKINLHGCKNKHNIQNIPLNKYEETQKIDLTKIICDICKKNNKKNTHNNDFYICNTCNKNICPLCKSIHDKDHTIINFDDKNFLCKKHNEPFNKYCKKCNEDICIICEIEHNKHEILDIKDLIINKNDLLKKNEDLKNVIDKFKNKINLIQEIFTKMINIMDMYYKKNDEIIKEYNINKRNYHKLQNLNILSKNCEIIINDINNMIKNDNMSKVIDFSFDNFYSENGEKYIGEMKNFTKEGNGVLYYSKDDKNKRKRYEGNFKNDRYEGKGILFYNDGYIYEGEFKNDKKEGKGKLFLNNFCKYEGEFKNDKKEGKGIMYYEYGDKYEGDFKNGHMEGKGIRYFSSGDRCEGDFESDCIRGKGIS